MTIETDITINAPLEKVFEAFSDLEGIQKRINGINEIEILNPPSQMQVGTKWKETRIVFGKEATETMWVTALEKNESYVVEAESNGTHYTSTYTFREADGVSHVHFSFTGKPLTFMAKLMSPMAIIFSKSLKKLMTQDMNDLKAYLES